MKTIFYYGTAVILFLIGLLLFWLTNSGALTFAEPYIIEKSQQLSPVPDVTAFTNVNVIPMNSEVIL
ncbi:MAG: hypothetical protein GY943_30840, partial [Chloroflexi bacterium]|nr:hypothetical protein [Chloroflexota bacterium]